MEAKDIKQKIIDEIAKTKMQIEGYREMTQPIAPDVSIGRVSRMDAINDKSIAEAALRQAEHKLLSLGVVLSKTNEKDFGICQRCKAPISLQRILIRPESLYCVHCAK
jgi:DnaK suppressor protein